LKLKVLGLIPARAGSKGVPDKNIKKLCGKPLLHYTIVEAYKSSHLSEIMVSTESEKIAKIAKQAEAHVPFMRPENLAEDNSKTLDVVIHVVEQYEENGTHFDAVCLLQPTNPLRKADLIDRCVKEFEHQQADSLITVRSVPHEFNPHWIFEENKQGFLSLATGEKEIIPRRQELPEAYYRDGSVYITKTEELLNKRSLYGEKIAYLNTDGVPHINIDTMADWKKAERLLCAE